MARQNRNSTDFLNRLIADLKRDKKKAIVLTVLVVVGALVVGRTFIGKGPPAAARADASPPATAAPSTPAATPFNPGTAALPSKAGLRRELYVSPAEYLFTRDIFVPNPDFFPPEQPAERPKPVSASGPGTRDKQAELEAIQNQARSLVLQSTIISDQRPTAIINGRVLGVGDWIDGFEVMEITSHACTLAKNSVQVVLEMKN